MRFSLSMIVHPIILQIIEPILNTNISIFT